MNQSFEVFSVIHFYMIFVPNRLKTLPCKMLPHGRYKSGAGTLVNISILLIIIQRLMIFGESAIEEIELEGPEMCDMDMSLSSESLSCRYIKNMDFVNQMTESITTLEIYDSSLPTLNLSMFHQFHTLESIAVTNSGLTRIEGRLPPNLISVNFSSNNLNVSSLGEFFSGRGEELSRLEILDLSHNWERNGVELPQSIFVIPSLKSLYLAGNHLEGHFVWSTMWEWVNNDLPLLKDADEALCVFPLTEFSLLGCLKAKTDVEDTCHRVDKRKCPTCVLHGLQKDLEYKFPNYPISHKGLHGSTAISLAVDCSNRSLRTLPTVPLQTWKVDVSHNLIEDLSPIKASPYVIYLDATNNSVRVESLLGSPFLDDFMSLSIQSNHIHHIPPAFLEAVRDVQNNKNKNKGDTFLGDNYLQCDCSTATETKRLLNSMRNPDWKEIFCGNMKRPDATEEFLPLKDLKIFDVCIIHKETNPDQQIWIYILIGGEVILILFIVGKVWYDQRVFRRTGKLPWCSQKMPRLPCDAILEGIKDRRLSNPNNTAITNTYSAHHSQSSVHRSNSGVGGRSMTLVGPAGCGSSSSRGNLRIPLVQFSMEYKTPRSSSDTSRAASIHSAGDIEDSRNLITYN